MSPITWSHSPITTWSTPSALVSRSRTSICQPPDPPNTSLALGYFFRVLLISPTSSRNFLFVYAVSFPPSVNIMLTGPRPIGSMVDIPIILVNHVHSHHPARFFDVLLLKQGILGSLRILS